MNHAKHIVELAEAMYSGWYIAGDLDGVSRHVVADLALDAAKDFYAAVEADEDLKDFDKPAIRQCGQFGYDNENHVWIGPNGEIRQYPPGLGKVSFAEQLAAMNYDSTQFDKGDQ